MGVEGCQLSIFTDFAIAIGEGQSKSERAMAGSIAELSSMLIEEWFIYAHWAMHMVTTMAGAGAGAALVLA